MDYTVGSLANLISGNKSQKTTKVVSKTFVPIKKDLVADEPKAISTQRKAQKLPRTSDTTSGTKKNKGSKANGEHNKTLKQREKKQHEFIEPNVANKKSFKRKREVVANEEESTLTEPEKSSPKKTKKENANDKNAATRIKKKIKKENLDSDGYTENTIFVGNVPIGIKKNALANHFKKYGPIVSLRFRGISVADPKTPKKVAAIKNEFNPNRQTLNAFIKFEKDEDAKKASAENGQLFMDRHLRVDYCRALQKRDESKAIFVGNLPFDVEDEELWKLFQPCGAISFVRVIRDGSTGMSKGFAYVNFKDSDAVHIALEMDDFQLKNRQLRISSCDINRAKKTKLGKKVKVKSEPGENREVQRRTFTGTKFSDKKKKKVVSKVALKKKKLAQKLTAPRKTIAG